MSAERHCKLHPEEELVLVEHEILKHGAVTLKATLYICEKCPEFLTESDTFTGELQRELGFESD